MDGRLVQSNFWIALIKTSAPWICLAAAVLAVGAWTAVSYTRQTFFYAGPPYSWPTAAPPHGAVQMGVSLQAKAMQSLTKALSTDAADRIYLLNYSVQPDKSMLFTLVGQSKDACVYHLRVGRDLYCSCEAFTRRPFSSDGETFTYQADPQGVHHCKHLFWLKLRILRIPHGHRMLFRLGYAPWELGYIAAHASFNAERAPPAMMQAYHSHTSAAIQVKPTPSQEVCSILCFEPVDPAAPYSYCEAGCQKAFFHPQCLSDYQAHCKHNNEEPRCPLCRAPLQQVTTEATTIKKSGVERTSLAGMRPSRSRSRKRRLQ